MGVQGINSREYFKVNVKRGYMDSEGKYTWSVTVIWRDFPSDRASGFVSKARALSWANDRVLSRVLG